MNIQPQQQQMILNNQQNPMLQQQQVMASRPQGYQQNPNQVPNQSLQQLLNALRTNTDSPPEQQQRLREILRSNPQLLAQFIRNQRQRQMFQQQQQQQGRLSTKY
uniref:Nuclear receptor coactivator CREB-bp-like interlocking domain-containing protein n=1 Tax=Schizaphis graminum TaxID=13262 RepID=A0A2S2PA40_SCHGA